LRTAPAFGLFFASVHVAGGLFLVVMTARGGNIVMAIPLFVDFPLIAPFAAVGLYEVARRIEAGAPLIRLAVAAG
jgi:uncharacterized membrane protein